MLRFITVHLPSSCALLPIKASCCSSSFFKGTFHTEKKNHLAACCPWYNFCPPLFPIHFNCQVILPISLQKTSDVGEWGFLKCASLNEISSFSIFGYSFSQHMNHKSHQVFLMSLFLLLSYMSGSKLLSLYCCSATSCATAPLARKWWGLMKWDGIAMSVFWVKNYFASQVAAFNIKYE